MVYTFRYWYIKDIALGVTKQSPLSPLFDRQQRCGQYRMTDSLEIIYSWFWVSLYGHIWTWMCNVVVNAKPSSEVMALRDESPSLPVVIPAYSMLETAFSFVDSDVSLKTSLDRKVKSWCTRTCWPSAQIIWIVRDVHITKHQVK